MAGEATNPQVRPIPGPILQWRLGECWPKKKKCVRAPMFESLSRKQASVRLHSYLLKESCGIISSYIMKIWPHHS